MKSSLVFLENKTHQTNSLNKNGIINLKSNKKPTCKTKTKPKKEHSLYPFLSAMPGRSHRGRNTPAFTACARHNGLHPDLPRAGHSWFPPALSQPRPQGKDPPGRQREAAHSQPRKTGTGLPSGLETPPPREAASALPQQGPAEGTARIRAGRPAGGRAGGLRPWAAHAGVEAAGEAAARNVR